MTGLATFLTDIGSIISDLVEYISTVLGLFTSTPVLAIVFAIFVIGACIGLGMRVLHRN